MIWTPIFLAGPFHSKIEEEEDKLLHLVEYLLRDRPSEQT